MGGHASFENMSYERTCLQVAYFTGECVLLEHISSRRTGLTGGYVM